MSTQHVHLARLRTRWSAIGAAVAITLGAGGVGLTHASIDTGDRPVSVSIAAERILDTRSNLGLSGRFADATPRDLMVTGPVDVASGTAKKTVVPDDAIGVQVNVTVVTPTHDGFLSLRPSGATGDPTTSTVNFTPGSIEPNAATVDLKDGKIQIWVETSSDAGAADVLIDIVGYTIGHGHDDRYYTKDEINAMLETKSDVPSGDASVRISAAAFAPANSLDNTMTYYRTSNMFVTQASTSTCFVAQAALPAGATVTSLTAQVQKDDLAGDVDIALTAYAATTASPMAALANPPSIGTNILSTSSISNAEVSASKDYVVHFCLTAVAWLNNVTINYTYPD